MDPVRASNASVGVVAGPGVATSDGHPPVRGEMTPELKAKSPSSPIRTPRPRAER
jgi:hypothetical protein